MRRPSTPDTEAAFAGELSAVRPDLSARYAEALPGARAAVLTRLWRALAYEPLPWIARRDTDRDGLTVRLADGRRLRGPHPDPYATSAYVTEVRLGGRTYDRPELLVGALGVPHGPAFAAELADSVASLALSRADQASDGAPGTSEASWRWEQRIVDGHPYHPNCRARPGFSVAEQLAYGPEHRPSVELGLVAVDDALVTGEWPKWLRDGERVLIPVHPWQGDHVLDAPVQEGFAARPLMSLRTLAVPDGPHVKTALSARLTSSVRDISVYSVETADRVSAFMEEMAARLDAPLHITRTLGAATAGFPDLAAVVRESPDGYAGAGERCVPVAALPLTRLPEKPSWLAEFTRLVLTVGLRLLEFGVALEAHGQNLLVILDPAGSPVRLVYRDLADIRVSPARLARHGIPVPRLSGRIVTDDETALRRKLFGSLVGGALGATAGSTAALRAALEKVAPDLPHTADLPALLGEKLPTKALTLMRLSPDTPGDLWTRLPQPLVGPGSS
ncbi:IucA/IucC family siderophore biosynthesis protein [Streptomyces rhizosphaerihabitans]|uniref:IucA/IucC family siderophore biosynthesis protein n=1 Tax=Streptomyces rhizosphaerihabitans TaxID=1266770 RepID=UPI0021BECF35|nr:IucA/IucC family siderophore biosynthesis protein [Streptomyces rhizosphaerihabitans]MCT9006165.1 IucA/IucC family siderophore biosynthesis protein [Streptomyces rhizosphaerihabitans]